LRRLNFGVVGLTGKGTGKRIEVALVERVEVDLGDDPSQFWRCLHLKPKG
jgi:hypothetical protein